MLRWVHWLPLIGAMSIAIVVIYALVNRPGPANEGLAMCPEGGTTEHNIIQVGDNRYLSVIGGRHAVLHETGRYGPEVAAYLKPIACIYPLGAHVLVVDLEGRWFVADQDLARVDGWSAPRRLIDRVGTAPLHALVLAVLAIAPFVLLARRARHRWLVGYAVAFAGLGWLAFPFAALI